MNVNIMKAVGFDNEVELVKAKKCPFCSETVGQESFRDAKSIKEFQISGLCQKCQDSFFGEEE